MFPRAHPPPQKPGTLRLVLRCQVFVKGWLTSTLSPRADRLAPAVESRVCFQPLVDAMVKTIVLVEDDADTRTVFHDALTAHGYRVIAAKHGAEGVTLARRHPPDLILMDIRMPVMDGWRALEYLKADPRTAHIPVWALSGYLPEEEAAQSSAQWSFDRVLAKPIGLKGLVAAVESYVGPPDPSGPHG